MKKLKEYKYIILIVIVILGVAFYWFQLRPFQIRKDCSKNLTGFGSVAFSGEKAYKTCLLKSGLEK